MADFTTCSEAKLNVLLKEVRESLHRLFENTTDFSSLHKTDEQIAECLRMALHGARKAFASFNALADVCEDLLELRILRLSTKDVEASYERHTGVDHG